MRDKFQQMLVQGLTRSTITSPSVWAEQYRVLKGAQKWSFKYFPWLRGPHDATEEVIVAQKCAQVGFTECGLNRAFYYIDVMGDSVLYLLPTTKPGASDFSSTRFDPALEESEHLRNLFQDNKNVGVKRAGSRILYVRGAGTNENVKSLPVAHMIFDECDEMSKEIIKLAFERTSGQFGKTTKYLLSTPSVDNNTVNYYYKQSSQDIFMFPCPSCNRLTHLAFPECLVVTATEFGDPDVKNSHLICKECKAILPHETKPEWLGKGRWVSSYTNKMVRGFHINQMYSMTIDPWKIANDVLEADISEFAEKELYNSKLGLPHSPKSGRITDQHIEDCIQEYTFKDSLDEYIIAETFSPNQPLIVTMGIDVGKVCYLEVVAWTPTPHYNEGDDPNTGSIGKVIFNGKIKNMSEIDSIWQRYKVNYAVIDAMPEYRTSKEFCNNHYGNSRMCYYIPSASARELIVNDEQVKVNRTTWLDLSLGRVMKGNIGLPKDISLEYRNHLKAQVREITKNKDGDLIPRWIDTEADHYGHARNYSEIALALAIGTGANITITEEVR